MRCDEFILDLEALVGGELPPERSRELEAHLLSCEECRARWLTARGLTGRILAAANLDPCAACEDALCDYVDGTLDDGMRGLVEMHIEGCAQCAELATELTALQIEMPRLKEVRVPQRVLANVMRAIAAEQGRTGWRPRLPEWRVLFARPRFASEAAFAMTMAWVLLFGIPAQESLATGRVEQTVTSLQQGLDRGADELGDRVADGMRSLETYGSRHVEAARELSRETGSRLWGQVRGWLAREDGSAGSTRG